MKAMDVMVRDVVTVKPETDVASAIKLLIEHDISALPVVEDGGRVVGVISEADLVHRAEIGTEKHRPWWLEALTPGSMLAAEFAKAHGLRVSEVMSPHVVSASEETPLAEIAALLEKHRIKRVPIIEDGKLVGIVSRSNLVQALASSLIVFRRRPVRTCPARPVIAFAWSRCPNRLTAWRGERGIGIVIEHSREVPVKEQAPTSIRDPGPGCGSSLSMFFAVTRKRIAAMATMAVPRTMSASPAILPNFWPGNESVRPANDGAATSRNRSNFSTRNPKAMTAIAVRTQARNVRSLAAWSL